MAGSKNFTAKREYGHARIPERRLSGTLMLMVMLNLGMFIMSPSSRAADNWDVEGANGTLYVHGALTESTCRLDMTSSRQDIALGESSTGELLSVGARGEPVGFELKLADCLRSPAGSHDIRTGSTVWADNQPAVTVSFQATRDANNPQLVKAHGVTGVGLRLLDNEGQDVRLGSRGKPMFLTPGQNSLRYTVTPERTSANLMAGYYQATVNFRLSYE